MVITECFNSDFGDDDFGDLVVSLQCQVFCATSFISCCIATLAVTFGQL